jgi:nucleotide-binding universal stress UspA family protein
MMYRNILLTVDGSATSDAALHEAVKLVQEGSRLRVITVADNPTLTFPSVYVVAYDVGAMREAILEDRKAVLEQAMAHLRKQGIDAESLIVDLTNTVNSNIAGAILDEAKRWPADIIVMGSHGRRGIKRVVLGSVAEEIMRSSTLPVLLARGPAMAESTTE